MKHAFSFAIVALQSLFVHVHSAEQLHHQPYRCSLALDMSCHSEPHTHTLLKGHLQRALCTVQILTRPKHTLSTCAQTESLSITHSQSSNRKGHLLQQDNGRKNITVDTLFTVDSVQGECTYCSVESVAVGTKSQAADLLGPPPFPQAKCPFSGWCLCSPLSSLSPGS